MNRPLQFTWPARIGAVLLLVIYGTPLYWLVSTSFKAGADVFRGLAHIIVFTPSLAAYQRVWNADLLHSAVNSALIAAGHDAAHAGARRAGRVCAWRVCAAASSRPAWR